jgi:hypothetical protein
MLSEQHDAGDRELLADREAAGAQQPLGIGKHRGSERNLKARPDIAFRGDATHIRPGRLCPGRNRSESC